MVDALTVEALREVMRVLGRLNTPEQREIEQERFELWLKVVNGKACYWYPPKEIYDNTD